MGVIDTFFRLLKFDAMFRTAVRFDDAFSSCLVGAGTLVRVGDACMGQSLTRNLVSKAIGDCAARATSYKCSKVWSILIGDCSISSLCANGTGAVRSTAIGEGSTSLLSVAGERVSCRGVIIRSVFE